MQIQKRSKEMKYKIQENKKISNNIKFHIHVEVLLNYLIFNFYKKRKNKFFS